MKKYSNATVLHSVSVYVSSEVNSNVLLTHKTHFVQAD